MCVGERAAYTLTHTNTHILSFDREGSEGGFIVCPCLSLSLPPVSFVKGCPLLHPLDSYSFALLYTGCTRDTFLTVCVEEVSKLTH